MFGKSVAFLDYLTCPGANPKELPRARSASRMRDHRCPQKPTIARLLGGRPVAAFNVTEMISGYRHAPDRPGLGTVAKVAPGGSIVVPPTAGIGAPSPLRRIPAIVSFLNPQRALSVGGGNWSSIPP